VARRKTDHSHRAKAMLEGGLSSLQGNPPLSPLKDRPALVNDIKNNHTKAESASFNIQECERRNTLKAKIMIVLHKVNQENQ